MGDEEVPDCFRFRCCDSFFSQRIWAPGELEYNHFHTRSREEYYARRNLIPDSAGRLRNWTDNGIRYADWVAMETVCWAPSRIFRFSSRIDGFAIMGWSERVQRYHKGSLSRVMTSKTSDIVSSLKKLMGLDRRSGKGTFCMPDYEKKHLLVGFIFY